MSLASLAMPAKTLAQPEAAFGMINHLMGLAEAWPALVTFADAAPRSLSTRGLVIPNLFSPPHLISLIDEIVFHEGTKISCG